MNIFVTNAVIIAIVTNPIKTTNEASIFPLMVMGTMSPYPSVDMVTIDHQILSGML